MNPGSGFSFFYNLSYFFYLLGLIQKRGDILVVDNTGAYSLAMSSNYNKLLKPAVVFVEDDGAYLAVKRESLEDLIKNDCEYKGE